MIRRRAGDQEGMAMIITVLLVVVIMSLSGVIASTLVSQSSSVLAGDRSTASLAAAKAGLQATIAQFRADYATVNNVTVGNPALLPCGTNALTGSVDGSSSLNYSVSVSYQNSAQTAMTCPFASSVNMTGSPSYAVVKSTGTATTSGQSSSRTLQAVYSFVTSNINIAGGLIEDSTNSYCLQASSAAPGATISFQPLSTCTNTALDDWVYSTADTLQLASSLGGTPLCITGASLGVATLANCVAAQWSQVWTWTGYYTWFGQLNPISNGNSGWALSWIGTIGTGTLLQVVNSPNATPSGTLFPTSAVGAGAASAATNQIVNYQQFGRCLDVTNQVITWAYEIVYPCKQDPTGNDNIFWNQKFFYTEVPAGLTSTSTTISVVDNGTSYCMTSSGAAGGYTLMNPCNGGAAQQWKRFYNTGNYAGSYLFVDYQGFCLDVTSGAVYSGYSAVVTNVCNGSTSQKWNGLPNPGTTALFNFLEGTS